jgi:hypothetical protein
MPLAIITGALLIAESILVVGRYSIGDVELFGTGKYVVYGVDP